MSKCCYLMFNEDGDLICTANHRDYKNCDLVKPTPVNLTQKKG